MFQLKVREIMGCLLVSMPYNALADDVATPPTKSDQNTCVVAIKAPAPKKYLQQQVISVPDQELNHDIWLGVTQQRMTDTKLCNGDLLVLKNAYFMQDSYGLNGEGRGYNIYITDKGDQIVIKTTSIASYKEGGAAVSHTETTGKIISGTGPYENITGTYKSIGESNRFKHKTKTIEQTVTIIFPSEETKVASK